MKHYVAYTLLVCIILLQWFDNYDSVSMDVFEREQNILWSVIVDRSDWCTRQGFNKVQ